MPMSIKPFIWDLPYSSEPQGKSLQRRLRGHNESLVGRVPPTEVSQSTASEKVMREQQWTLRFVHAGWPAG